MLAGLEAFLHVFLLGDTKLWQVWVFGQAGSSLPGVKTRRWRHTDLHLKYRYELKVVNLDNTFDIWTYQSQIWHWQRYLLRLLNPFPTIPLSSMSIMMATCMLSGARVRTSCSNLSLIPGNAMLPPVSKMFLQISCERNSHRRKILP